MIIKTRMWSEEEKKYYYFEGVFNRQPFKELSTFPQYESIKQYKILSEPELYSGFKDRHYVDIYEGDRIQQSYLGRTIVEEKIVNLEWIVEQRKGNQSAGNRLIDVLVLKHPERVEK